ncbi:MAG TPA: DUF456 domain-containing protein [Bacteroidales bacterium]|nr:DUF456 domain-containing protein [Bacteroidales bacterium]HRZ48667.1 DUF456 domain-containing protein [Bacteroidales bacterium]
MEVLFIVIGIVCIILGILGCFLPVIPGPPIAWVAMLLLQITEKENRPFTINTLVIWGAVVIIVTVLDYVVPIWGTKKFGGSKYGTWGSTIGLIIGLFFAPYGIIIGPFAGAVAGELIGGMSSKQAFRAGVGSFLGFLTGVFLKLAVTVWMGVLFFRAAWGQISTMIN